MTDWIIPSQHHQKTDSHSEASDTYSLKSPQLPPPNCWFPYGADVLSPNAEPLVSLMRILLAQVYPAHTGHHSWVISHSH